MRKLLLGIVICLSNIVYAENINYYNQLSLLNDKINIFNSELKNQNVHKIPTNFKVNYGGSNNELFNVKEILYINGEIKDHNFNNTFDDDLFIALKEFQINNNLEVNGKLDKNTIKKLNNYDKLLIGLKYNYEFLKSQKGYESNMIIVNIPEYKLSIYENYSLVKSINVIVGKSNKQTCILSSYINKITFNPSWYVPDSIANTEMLDKLNSNPEYFIKHNFKVYSNGEEIDLNNYDSTATNLNDLKFVQQPSESNALGKIKFSFNNDCGIYLHDTNQRNLFEYSEKQNLSHGCVRIQNPIFLAKYLLSYNGLNSNIDNYYNSNKTKIINLNNPYQINIIYQNVLINENNEIVNFKDIYNKIKN